MPIIFTFKPQIHYVTLSGVMLLNFDQIVPSKNFLVTKCKKFNQNRSKHIKSNGYYCFVKK